jgi:hypothetical protein
MAEGFRAKVAMANGKFDNFVTFGRPARPEPPKLKKICQLCPFRFGLFVVFADFTQKNQFYRPHFL